MSSVKPLSAAERRAIETFLAGAYSLDDVVTRTVRLLVQLTRQVAVVQYPSLTRSAIRHIELVPLAPQRLLLVLITDTGRVEQCTVDLPDPWDDASVSHVRAVVNACLGGHKLSDAAAMVTDLAERIPAEERDERERRPGGAAGQPGRAERGEDRLRRSREPGRARLQQGVAGSA